MVKVTRLSLLCFLENALAFISSVPRLILVKGLGQLATLQLPCLLCLSFTFLLLKPKTPKYLPSSVCSPFLIQFHLSTPPAPRGIDTLIYRKATIDPLDLWVIKNRFLARLTGKATQLNLLTSPPSTSFLAPLPGSVALLVSEAGKETFIFCCLLSVLMDSSA